MANLANGGAGNGNRTRAGNSRDVSGRDSRTAPHASGGPEATPRHRVTRRVRTPDAGSPDRGPRGAGARGPVADFFVRLVRETPLGLMGAAIILLLLVCGIFADVLTRYEVDEIIVLDRLAPPSAKHLLGADGAGRDILTRLIHGARISLVTARGWETSWRSMVDERFPACSGLDLVEKTVDQRIHNGILPSFQHLSTWGRAGLSPRRRTC